MGAKKKDTVENRRKPLVRIRVLENRTADVAQKLDMHREMMGARVDVMQRALELQDARITALENAVRAGQAAVEAAPKPDPEAQRLKDAVVVEVLIWESWNEGRDAISMSPHERRILKAAQALVAHRKNGGG